jgi:flagellar basal-body rod protein FlgC
MDLFNILSISTAGLTVERTRLEVAVTNLANAQTTAPPGGLLYQPVQAILRSASPVRLQSSYMDGSSLEGSSLEAALPRPFVAEIAPMSSAPRRVYDPGHPDADAQGFVSYPGVDPVTTMLDLLSISRSYEANVKAFDITRTLLERTLDMGSQR